jgi:cob(I)alamin adenosyltransferase
MVYLNRIYTKGGDGGETSLGDGSRVKKTAPRIAAYGTTDELNSVLGVVLANSLPESLAAQIRHIQNDLFDLGADLCVPESEPPPEHPPLRVTADQVTRLENWIDAANEGLKPLESFVLPGGSPASAYLHLARTVCRRAEIAVLRLMADESVNRLVAVYLNRLSDLLFVLARACNDNGERDVLWLPGKHRGSASAEKPNESSP